MATETIDAHRPTDELVSGLLAVGTRMRTEDAQIANEAAVRLDSLQAQLQLERDERTKIATEVSMVREYRPSDHELRMQAAMSAVQANTDNHRYLAEQLYEFLTDTPEVPPRDGWEPPTVVPDESRAEYVRRALFEGLGAASMAWSQTPRGVFDSTRAKSIGDALTKLVEAYAEGEGPHVEIGGQRMTQAQFDAARHPLLANPGEALPPAHGLAVGDVLTRDQAAEAPVGTEFTDKDGDRLSRASGGRHPLLWEGHYGWMHGSAYGPYTVTQLPEDTTPREGDTVRVREGVMHCTGFEGTLTSTPGSAWEYGVRDERDGHWKGWQHNGPLSDFELIERAK